MLDNLKKYNILLASKSPRRRELLANLRIPFSVVNISNIKEDYPEDLPVRSVAQYLSEIKADAYNRFIKDDEMVITADTVVITDGKIYGKPQNRDEALDMLKTMSGKTHLVSTGVTIVTKDKRSSFTVETRVSFATIDEEEIKYYVDNFSPFDKAGAYGIQEWIGCIAVEKIDGSFYNVMGLPIHRLYKELKLF